jgi:hypothetical protein
VAVAAAVTVAAGVGAVAYCNDSAAVGWWRGSARDAASETFLCLMHVHVQGRMRLRSRVTSSCVS